MNRQYSMSPETKGDRDFASRAVGHANPDEFIRFIDALRDEGPDRAMSLFPTRWEWMDDERSETYPAMDFVPHFGAGMVLTEKAFVALERKFPHAFKTHGAFQLDGMPYYWVWVLVVREGAAAASLSDQNPVNVLLPGARFLCGQEFVDAWTAAGLTGLRFRVKE
jgi:hypothetical protein